MYVISEQYLIRYQHQAKVVQTTSCYANNNVEKSKTRIWLKLQKKTLIYKKNLQYVIKRKKLIQNQFFPLFFIRLFQTKAFLTASMLSVLIPIIVI